MNLEKIAKIHKVSLLMILCMWITILLFRSFPQMKILSTSIVLNANLYSLAIKMIAKVIWQRMPQSPSNVL